jgi:hypothetical protein
MEQTECSETSAYKIQTPGNYPEANIQHTADGESLKSRKRKTYLTFVRPSSTPSLRTTHSFTFSTFPVVPARYFAKGMTTQCCQPWESHVCMCVCRKPLCLYDNFFDLLNLFRPSWEMFRERHDNTVIHASHMGNYMLHARGSEALQTFTFRLLKGKRRPSVTFHTDRNIPISLHVFAFLLIVEQDTVFIHDAAFFFLHLCSFA